MSEAVVYDRNPAELELEPGEYWWCSCGRSMTQPFCDGSHEGTDMEPMSIVIAEKTTVWLCNCKHTKPGSLSSKVRRLSRTSSPSSTIDTLITELVVDATEVDGNHLTRLKPVILGQQWCNFLGSSLEFEAAGREPVVYAFGDLLNRPSLQRRRLSFRLGVFRV